MPTGESKLVIRKESIVEDPFPENGMASRSEETASPGTQFRRTTNEMKGPLLAQQRAGESTLRPGFSISLGAGPNRRKYSRLRLNAYWVRFRANGGKSWPRSGNGRTGWRGYLQRGHSRRVGA
jgi:hypothetical protein